MIFFPDRSGVAGVRFPANSISSDDPIMKAWKYRMVAYLMEISNLKFLFFSRLTKFQQCMFKRIHWIIISLDDPTQIPCIRSLYVEVHYTVIEYKNEKAKSAHYLVQLVDLDDPNDQQ